VSLYNALFGVQALFAAAALAMLGIEREDVPRFRDAYFMLEEGRPIIVVHTRTGGGNREDYEAENERLTKLPGYLYDRDDDFDCTYADFCYEVPEANRQAVADALAETGNPRTPAERWQALFAALSAPNA